MRSLVIVRAATGDLVRNDVLRIYKQFLATSRIDAPPTNTFVNRETLGVTRPPLGRADVGNDRAKRYFCCPVSVCGICKGSHVISDLTIIICIAYHHF